jgi:RNA polymerase sigma factor (sigma-70 family)
MLAETVEQLLENLGPPEREIVELSLQGHTTPEIAARLGRSRRTVRRVRERVKDVLLRLKQEDDPPATSPRPAAPGHGRGGGNAV